MEPDLATKLLEEINKRNNKSSFDRETILRIIGIIFICSIIIFFFVIFLIKQLKNKGKAKDNQPVISKSLGVAIGQSMIKGRTVSPIPPMQLRDLNEIKTMKLK